MEKLRDTSFGARLGAFVADLITICTAWVFASFTLMMVVVPSMPRHSGADWISSATAAEALLSTLVLLPIVYAAGSWSPLFGRRSLGKHLFHLRVVRDDG